VSARQRARLRELMRRMLPLTDGEESASADDVVRELDALSALLLTERDCAAFAGGPDGAAAVAQ
ncbi:MAG TPA: hypothetical protein VIE14_00210, partial [Steroidobacteraceae bacterium]